MSPSIPTSSPHATITPPFTSTGHIIVLFTIISITNLFALSKILSTVRSLYTITLHRTHHNSNPVFHSPNPDILTVVISTIFLTFTVVSFRCYITECTRLINTFITSTSTHNPQTDDNNATLSRIIEELNTLLSTIDDIEENVSQMVEYTEAYEEALEGVRVLLVDLKGKLEGVGSIGVEDGGMETSELPAFVADNNIPLGAEEKIPGQPPPSSRKGTMVRFSSPLVRVYQDTECEGKGEEKEEDGGRRMGVVSELGTSCCDLAECGGGSARSGASVDWSGMNSRPPPVGPSRPRDYSVISIDGSIDGCDASEEDRDSLHSIEDEGFGHVEVVRDYESDSGIRGRRLIKETTDNSRASWSV